MGDLGIVRRYTTPHTFTSAIEALVPELSNADAWDQPAIAEAAWEAALWWWAYLGDGSHIAQLAAKRVPIDADGVATLAAIIDGQIRAKAPEMGRRQLVGRSRDFHVRRNFEQFLKDVKRDKLPGQVIDSRAEAAAMVASRLNAAAALCLKTPVRFDLDGRLKKPLTALTEVGVQRKVDRKPTDEAPKSFESLVLREGDKTR